MQLDGTASRCPQIGLIRVLRLLLFLLVAQPCLFASQASWADSGGYSRPSSSSLSSHTGNGGYSRPSTSSSNFSGSWGSGGDKAISRRNSGQALQNYRSSNRPSAPSRAEQRRPPVEYDSGFWGNTRRPQAPAGYGTAWGQQGSYPPMPSGYKAGPSRFGAWDAVMLWALLNNVTSPRSSNFFIQNQTDPGYLQWRAETDRLAANNPDLAAKLAQLDQQLAKNPAGNAAQNNTGSVPAAGADGGYTMLLIVVGLAVFLGLWLMRRRAASPAAPRAQGPAGISGSTQMRFRVGMTMPLDPAPFILSAGLTKIVPPAEGNLISVEAVGLVSEGAGAAGGMTLHRLYLPGGKSFFALHLGPSGQPDECRYFSLIDQVTPATEQDWAFWLDPAQGMIGWPEFQTKDGLLYGRVWAEGTARVPPRDQVETLQDLSGEKTRNLQAMLYGRSIGAKPPAPESEYILVEAIEQDGSAWVEIHAGIDINPAALTLPSVAFT
jgi:hypothetical protein